MKKSNRKSKIASSVDKADSQKVNNGKTKNYSDVTASDNVTEPNFTPKEFDTFVPWVCRQFTEISVVITHKTQGECVSDKKTIQLKKTISKDGTLVGDSEEGSSNLRKVYFTDNPDVPITAYYDVNHKLVEISIIGSEIKVPRQVISALGLAAPHHSSLKRFTFRRSHLTAALIHDINKLLHISNISEIILDDSYVPEGNYFILLEQLSQLNYLSLSRCKINDEACKKIFKNISFGAPAANSLQILDLGSNHITDNGATFIGSVLRANRCLLHLNLSGNRITDSGFRKILESLMEFPLDTEEERAAKGRRIRYLQNKMAVYAQCKENLKSEHSESVMAGKKVLKKCLRLHKTTSKKSAPSIPFEDEAEAVARRIVKEFHDPFSPHNVVHKNDLTYCKGNFVLSSINIAYNELLYPSIRMLREVLEYQVDMCHKEDKHTGLIRIVLNGNRLPETCTELNVIDLLLRNAVKSRTATDDKKLKSIAQKKSFYHGSRSSFSTQIF